MYQKVIETCGMATDLPTLFAARRARLIAWIADHYGKQSDFRSMTGINQGLLSALLRDGSGKSFGEKIAIDIERVANQVTGKPQMPPNYLLYPFPTAQSQPERLDLDILTEAFGVAAKMKGGPTPELIRDVYDQLVEIGWARPVATITNISPAAPKPRGSHGTDTGTNSGAVSHSGRKVGTRKK